MAEIFIKILNMSIAAGYIIIAVLILRLLLKRIPKWINTLLWGFVALRLVCPFNFESILSLIPSAQTVSPDIMNHTAPSVDSGIPAFNNAVNPIIEQSFAPKVGDSVNPLQTVLPVVASLWAVGALGMLIYAAVSYVILARRVSTAVRLKDNVYQSERVVSPFVLGIFKPRIYLPYELDGDHLALVLAHEQAHIKRSDHIWKPIGFILLALYWFDPLIWVAYVMLCRDIEFACDERVIKDMDREKRADYLQILLAQSARQRVISACPVAFGEVGVKGRMKKIISYKRPSFWVMISAVLLAAIIAVCGLTDPISKRLGSIDGLNINFDATVFFSHASPEADMNIAQKCEPSNIRELFDLKISSTAASKDLSDNRDKTHSLLLSSNGDAIGVYFNAHFTAVYLGIEDKLTSSYRVKDPNAARSVYYKISKRINVDALKQKYPSCFEISTFKGLEVCIWQMAKDSYYCLLLPGKNSIYTNQELWSMHNNAVRLSDMQRIITYYILVGEVERDEVFIHPITMPHSSYAYNIDGDYALKVNNIFWSEISY